MRDLNFDRYPPDSSNRIDLSVCWCKAPTPNAKFEWMECRRLAPDGVRATLIAQYIQFDLLVASKPYCVHAFACHTHPHTIQFDPVVCSCPNKWTPFGLHRFECSACDRHPQLMMYPIRSLNTNCIQWYSCGYSKGRHTVLMSKHLI